jgi:hypothetical protein
MISFEAPGNPVLAPPHCYPKVIRIHGSVVTVLTHGESKHRFHDVLSNLADLINAGQLGSAP